MKQLEELKKRLALEETKSRLLARRLLDSSEEQASIRRQIDDLVARKGDCTKFHLQPIHDEAGLTKEQKRLIRLGHRSNGHDHWRKRIEIIKATWDRKAKMEVRFCRESNMYIAKVYQHGELYQTLTCKPSRRNEIRLLIDFDTCPIFPWKTINQGNTWIVDVDLCPYKLERSWIPENVISLHRKSTGA